MAHLLRALINFISAICRKEREKMREVMSMVENNEKQWSPETDAFFLENYRKVISAMMNKSNSLKRIFTCNTYL